MLANGISKSLRNGQSSANKKSVRSSRGQPKPSPKRAVTIVNSYKVKPIKPLSTVSNRNYAMFNEIPGVPGGQMETVYKHIVDEGVFNSQVVKAEVESFYNLGLQQYYWERFSPAEIARHVHSFIAAKKLALTVGTPEDINFALEAPDHSTAFYISSDDHAVEVACEAKVSKLIEGLPKDLAYSYVSFVSEHPIITGGKKKLVIRHFETSSFNPHHVADPLERDVNKTATTAFLRKPALIRDRYQEIINTAIGKLSPIFKVYEPYRDGTIPVMMCFKRGDGTSYLARISELIKYNGLTCKRKFVETFSNGLIFYTLYLTATTTKAKIDQLLNQTSLTVLLPRSSLTAQFLNGTLSAEEYAYAHSTTMFTYYFTHRKDEDFDALIKSFANDPLNLSRVKSLQAKGKREAVTTKRIHECIINNAALTKEIYDHFESICLGTKKVDGKALVSRIIKLVENEVDEMILLSMVTFNESIVKTNFYASKKSALSFRLDPHFMANLGWPQVPYGLFLVVGYEFHGFHVRFDDIARGGIRIIRSANETALTHNFETVFQENYALAHTQNRKNKDIPEFGSKGTILLNRDNQGNGELAFQKYVSGLVDLLVIKDGIFDRSGQEEILFLGPDEGTADFMWWAADYARRRNYKYWKAFTTGKPPSLGGIPHDLFGMTTQSVHTYVLGCLKKLNLPENSVTKLQTGGPDGDLGSNEILISKDKTIAVIDGAGVLYDPAGIDRSELTRLAKVRSMVKGFDKSKLGPGGFLVLTSDRDVTLPTGELVENGLTFRNEFHLHPLSSAQLFVPCGGRPGAINGSNVHRLFDAKGQPRFQVIVEGANLFLTQDARMVLEKAGVVLYKDASANKGGVTSSSLEVLAALTLNDAEFQKNMMVTSETYPDFYKEYVEEVQKKICGNAALEFECIWKEHEKTGKPRHLLTDEVSEKINTLNVAIQKSALWDNMVLRKKVLSEALPVKLTSFLGVDVAIQRVPEAYAKAIFGAHLAAHFVYKNGVSASEFAFFEFMQGYLEK